MNKSLSTAVCLLALALSCGGKKTDPPVSPAPLPEIETVAEALTLQADFPSGLSMRLTEGTPPRGPAAQNKLADATPLTAAMTNQLLNRLPSLAVAARKSFAMRERSLPPPRTGETVDDAFPPPPSTATAPSAANKEPLSIRRFAPEGDVPLAPHLSVTFSEPMVAVTSHKDTIKNGVPVILTPQPKGQWRWVGTKTLLFDPDVRFPQATDYTVEIPAGVVSAAGKALNRGKTWQFRTPPTKVIQFAPQNGPHELEPLMFAEFDQRINAEHVLATIKVKAKGESYGVRFATAQELKKDAAVRSMVESAEKADHQGRYLVFRSKAPLPKAAQVTVEIGPGTPSAEGPKKTTEVQRFSFHTYYPLAIERHQCSWGSRCPPLNPFHITLNNPLDEDAFDPSMIEISPQLNGKRIQAVGNTITIQGMSKGQTTYTVRVAGSLRDKWSQTLGSEKTVTFKVGKAEPRLWGESGLVVLDPAGRQPTFDIFSINHDKLKVRIYKVGPEDWDGFARYMRDYRRTEKKTLPPGKIVFDKIVDTNGKTDEMSETAIDLSPAMRDGLGHAVVIIELAKKHKDDWRNPIIQTWVQSTKIGLDAFVDGQNLVAWSSNLADGNALSGMSLEIAPNGARGTSKSDGLATIALPKSNSKKGKHLLIARRGGDVAFLPEDQHWWSDYGGWTHSTPSDSMRWFVYDDRGMYRPGEEVHLKGWVRKLVNKEGGDIEGIKGAAKFVEFKVRGPRGNDITKGRADLNAMGGFDLKFSLPKTPNLGQARVELSARGGRGSMSSMSKSHYFQIQEFRRPEYEVSVTASPGPYMVGDKATVTAKAAYYAGGGLGNAEINWNVSASTGTFSPPNRGDYTFGTWIPWWRGQPGSLSTRQHLQSTTDASGSHILDVEFLAIKPPRPMNVVAEAAVTDVNRQAWAAQATMLIHPADLYVGLRRDKYFVRQGEPINVDAIVVDHDGKAITGRAVSIKAVLLEWAYKSGEWKQVERGEQECAHKSTAREQRCTFATDEGGQYRITATIVDDKGRPNQSELTMWVSGGKQPASRDVEKENVTLIPDKKEYAPGDTAKILVLAPFYPAEGVLTIRRSGIVSTRRFSVKGPSTSLDIPVGDVGFTPNMYAHVDLIGAAMRLNDRGEEQPKLPKRPAFASGSINLPIPPVHRTLSVKAVPKHKKIEPGGNTFVDVTVTDHRGRPVRGAELSVVVVDESVLSLSGYKTPDPVALFYRPRNPGGRDYHAREFVKLARPESIAPEEDHDADGVFDMDDAEGAGPMGSMQAEESAMPASAPRKSRALRKESKKSKGEAMGGEGSKQSAIKVRKNFNALATFNPQIRTDARGRAMVQVRVPDNLTRYRVMVAAASGDRQFGAGESAITARMPLMVRPSPPRFLNFGDKFELPIVVQNQTNRAMKVQVAVRADNALLSAGGGRQLTVPANDRVEVRFPAAAMRPGTANFQVGASAGKWADANEFKLPVWTPATTEAFATYGEIDKGAIRQPVKMPTDVVEEFGGLQVTTSSTQLQALTDALLYIVAYPFECAEQMSSRVLAIAALRDVLTAFDAEGLPPAKDIEAAVARDLRRLRGIQNYDGGFGFWYRGSRSWPYISIHVAHALTRAKDKGYEVPQRMLDDSKRYLRAIERHIPSSYPLGVRRTLISYALYVRKRMGDPDLARGRKLFQEAGLKGLSFEALGWMLWTHSGDKASRAVLSQIHRHLQNRATETAATATFAEAMTDGAHLILHSSRRVDAILLEALIEDRPKSDLIPKLTRGLLAHRVRGRWGNTQENVFVLLALDQYFKVFEKVTPDFVSRLWLGAGFVGDHTFKGRTTERHNVEVPMSYLAQIKKGDLVVDKDGKGRLYYRIGMTYAPSDLKLGPADHGFAVERIYEAVDDPGDVKQGGDGTWIIKAGARVRVRLTMVAESRRYHVALVDPLPAGLEPMNPALKVTGALPEDPKSAQSGYWWWRRTWYEHQNMRDERVEAFASLLWAGVHEYTYVARATTPGHYVVPPTKAEEMYFPETFGRTASDKVIVK